MYEVAGRGISGDGGAGMSGERGMDFESAVFGVIVDNIEDHQKRQTCLQGVMDCVRKGGKADQLPIPARKEIVSSVDRDFLEALEMELVAKGFLSPDVMRAHRDMRRNV